jgi:hypothetical protein
MPPRAWGVKRRKILSGIIKNNADEKIVLDDILNIYSCLNCGYKVLYNIYREGERILLL